MEILGGVSIGAASAGFPRARVFARQTVIVALLAAAAGAQESQEGRGENPPVQETAGQAASGQEGNAPAGGSATPRQGGDADQQGQGEDAGPQDGYVLEKLIVRSRRYRRSFFDTPQSVTVIDEREVHEKNAGRLADLLRDKPGIWVADNGTMAATPVIRGFIGKRVVNVYDGIRQNTASLFSGPNSFLGSIDPFDVDRVEVIRGAGSVFYGSDAIGGVVNIITNEEPRFGEGLELGARSFFRYESSRRSLASRQEFQVSSEDWFAAGGAMYRDSNDLRTGRGSPNPTLDPSDFRDEAWDLELARRLGEGHSLQFFLQRHVLLNGHLVGNPTWLSGPDRRTLVGLRYQGDRLAGLEDVQATVYGHEQDRQIDEQYWDSDNDEFTAGFDFQARAPLADTLDLTLGTHYHRDRIQKSNPQVGTKDPDVSWDNPALFGLLEWRPHARITVEASARYDYTRLDSQAPSFSSLPGPIQQAIQTGQFALSDLEITEAHHAVTGGLGLALEALDHVNLTAYVGRGFRAPNKSDMLSFGAHTFGVSVPSPGLDPETSVTWETGPKFDFPTWGGYVVYYETRVRNIIGQSPGSFGGNTFIDLNGNGTQDPGEQIFVNRNADEAFARGIEAEGHVRLPRQFNAFLRVPGLFLATGTFAWMNGRNGETGEPLDRGLGGLFPANGTLGLRWQDDPDPDRQRVFVEGVARMVRRFARIADQNKGDQAYKDDVQDKTSALLRADNSVPGFSTFDLRGGWKINDRATLTLAVENLTDKRHRFGGSRSEGSGINFVAALELTF